MATINISLPDLLRDYIDQEVSSGGFSSTSEYFRQLIREDQKPKAREQLDALILEGIDSGPSKSMTAEEWADTRREVAKRLSSASGR